MKTRTVTQKQDIKEVVNQVSIFAKRQGLLIEQMREQQQLLGELTIMVVVLTESLKAMSDRQNKDDGFAGNDFLTEAADNTE